MKKRSFNIQGAQMISKRAQRKIRGGLSACERGCYFDFVANPDGESCTITTSGGQACLGVIQDQLFCCIF